MSSDYFYPRSCHELKKDEAGRHVIDRNHAKPLKSHRNESAYVLLGQPGSGKTTAFKEEAEQPGCKYITARKFIALSRDEKWQDKILFIDGLDEVRAIKKNDPFDEICAKLDRLKPPGFRIACREADWDVTDDREWLKEVSLGRDVKELFLAELEEKEIEQILINGYQMSPQEADSFLQKVEQDELTALIKNPHTLEMLVLVAEKGDWPKTRLEIFQVACEWLLAEWNRVHNKADISQRPGSEALMRAAGSLCATLLLAGKEEFAELRADADEDYPFIGDLDIDDTGLLPQVAKTKLFAKPDKYIECSHRTYAEYLSAYYLSWKIQQGLPVGRVLALLERGGEVIPGLRGVLAWLATLHSQERLRLMRRDPLGVALYGDVSLFGREQRLALLDELGRQAEEKGGAGINYWNARSFGGFCQADMEQEFLTMLQQSTDHGDAQQQWRLFYVLAAMFHGEALPKLSAALEALIRNPKTRAENRRVALGILIRFGDKEILQAILRDVDRNIIIDSEDDLLGMLLNHLYPERVASSELFDYLHSPKVPYYIGDYWFFWDAILEKKSNDDQARQLLDALVNKQIATKNFPPLSYLNIRSMIGKLLARGLEKFGDVIEVEQLSNWLGLAVDEYGSMRLDRVENSEVIYSWIEQRPAIQKKLLEHYLEQCINSEDFEWRMPKKATWLFYGNLNLFEDYVRLCLDKAREASNEKIAEWLFEQSVGTLYGGKGNVGRSLELIEETLRQDPRLTPHWERLRLTPVDHGYGVEYWNGAQQSKEKRRQEEEKQRKVVQDIGEHLDDIETGMASPVIFRYLGAIYYGSLLGVVGGSPEERLRNYFKGNPGLVGPILTGLQNFLRREDLPTVEAIIELNSEKGTNTTRLYVHSLPCLAGMNELGQKGKQAILDLGEDNIKKALAFCFTYAGYLGGAPEWYKTLLKEKPDWVAEVYGKYGKAALRAGKSPNMIYALAYDEDHAQIARDVAISLLSSVPARIAFKQIDPLHRLLNAALQHADENQLKEVIREKTRLKSMDLRQRANWLTVGFILDLEGFETLLRQFVAERKSRIDYLSGFLSSRIDQWSPVEKMSLSALALFIGLFGPRRAPYEFPSSGTIDNPEYELSRLISQMIQRLQDIDVALEAIEATKELLKRSDLAKWHPSLRTALQAQRSSNSLPVSLEQVRRTLKNGPPANAADLKSLTCDHIRALAKQIKNGNTNDYMQYWMTYGEEPQHEEECRDRFLSALRPRLSRHGVDAQPEPRYRHRKRADIRVSYRDSELSCNVPIEIKCSDSEKLWSGIRQQLIENYAQDPGADGYGIYLVFWFGSKDARFHPEEGRRPKTPEELQALLEQSLDNEKRKRISVCVVDCTGPG